VLEDGLLPPAPRPLVEGTMIGEYRIHHKLGEGGMAEVYAAVHPLIGKKAAIKIMSRACSNESSSVARFILEARAVNRIGHPNIVDVFNFGRLPDGRHYFVMEWLQGESLYERLWRLHGESMPLPEVINILYQVCDALEAVHEKGIVHRDLKPANIFLCRARIGGPHVKLLDFGVAKLANREMSPRWTSAGAVVGTPEYVSPEQARGRNVDGRADLYSLGIIAYEMLLGRPPFLSDNCADAIHMHLSAMPPRPRILWPDIPPELEHLILRLLAKSPKNRAGIDEVRRVLGALEPTATPATDRVDQAWPPVRLSRRRHVVRMVAVALAFAFLSFAGYRPETLSAQKLHGEDANLAKNVTTAAALVEPPSATAAALLQQNSVSQSATSRAICAPNPRPARRIHRDVDYLLDPFQH
jgi:serine/threonine-protein kinase